MTTSLPTVLTALDNVMPVYAIPLAAQQIGDKGVKHIAKSLLKSRNFKQYNTNNKYHPIEACDFSNNALTDNCLNDISLIVHAITTLKDLKLNGNALLGQKDSTSSLFEAISNNTTLKSLRLENNDLHGENAMNAIANCLRRNRTAFSTFNLQINPIGDSGLKILSKVFALQRHNIRILKLWRCDIGNEGFIALSNAFKTNKTIDEAILHHNDIGDEGMYVFADAMEKNTTLTKIDLRHNSFSDRGVAKLIPVIIEKNNTLYSIQLEHNDNLHSDYIVNKLYDHVDRNNIGVFKREEERIQKERLKREELQLLMSVKKK